MVGIAAPEAPSMAKEDKSEMTTIAKKQLQGRGYLVSLSTSREGENLIGKLRVSDAGRSFGKSSTGCGTRSWNSAAPCSIGRWGPRPGPPFPRSSRGGEAVARARRHRAGDGTMAAARAADPRCAPEPGG